jgi:hypothetical protein
MTRRPDIQVETRTKEGRRFGGERGVPSFIRPIKQ